MLVVKFVFTATREVQHLNLQHDSTNRSKNAFLLLLRRKCIDDQWYRCRYIDIYQYLSQGNVLSLRGHPFNAWYSALFGRFRMLYFNPITQCRIMLLVPAWNFCNCIRRSFQKPVNIIWYSFSPRVLICVCVEP